MGEDVENFLAHYGVKGMKWGERKVPTPAKATIKALSKELAWGSLGPAAVIAGLGPPVSIAVGLSAAVLSKPPVQKAIASGARTSATLMKELGETKMSAMREANEAKKQAKKTIQQTEAATKAGVKRAEKALDVSLDAAEAALMLSLIDDHS